MPLRRSPSKSAGLGRHPSPGGAVEAAQAEDGELISRIRRGDAAGYDLLVRRYLKRGMAVAWEYTGNREDAEDVVQEAFRRVLKSLSGFDGARPFRPWFFTIVRNAALSLEEQAARLTLVTVPETLVAQERTPMENASVAELRERLDRALETLSEMQQRSFRFCALEGFTSAEAGEVLGIKEETVRTHVFRARRALNAMLTQENEEGRTA